MAAHPAYNILVTIDIDTLASFESNDYFHQKIPLNSTWKEKTIEMYVFKAGVITNLRNKTGGDKWCIFIVLIHFLIP